MAKGDQWKSYLLGHHEFRELSTDALFVDPSYQRDLNHAAIKRYVNGFDPNKFEPLTVNERKNGGADSHWALLDGQHRKATAQKLGMRAVTCRILHVDPKTEAQLFVELNKDRLRVPPVDRFKAELNYNPATIEIQKCLEARELAVSTTDNKRSISAVVALETIYARGGYVRLGRLLDVTIMAWPDDEPSRFMGALMLGLDEFLGSDTRRDINLVAEKLARTGPQQLLAQADKRWHGHRALGETSKSRVNCITEAIEVAYLKRGSGRQAVAA